MFLNYDKQQWSFYLVVNTIFTSSGQWSLCYYYLIYVVKIKKINGNAYEETIITETELLGDG